VGYDVVFITFDANGNPRGLPVPVLGGFLTDHGDTRGRPTWLVDRKAIAPQQALRSGTAP